jgi:hypothetical protein
MGIPQVSDQVRRAPTLALRAVFTGIGRILMTADRPPASVSGAQARAEPQQAPGKRRQRPGPAQPAQPSSRWRSLDQTGNVRLLSAEDLDDDDEMAPASPAVVANGSGPALPLDGYDSLSLASIRARLRTLDARQLRVLAEYERGHAERPEVLGMYERRIEKLETGG